MLILLDECVPRPFRRLLVGYDARTIQEMGWAGKENGELLAVMLQAQIEVLLTVDRNLRYQQNVLQSGVSIIVMLGVSNRLSDLELLAPQVLAALNHHLRPGEVIEVRTP